MFVPRMDSWVHKNTNKNQDNGVPCSFSPGVDIFRYSQNRTLNYKIGQPQQTAAEFLSKQLPGLLKQKEYDLGQINKIFTAQWVSDRQVAIGTKCNKLIVMDLITKQMARIPSLKSSDISSPAPCPCGIHSISVNPSRTLLATGAEYTNDLAVYKLPTLDPVCVGEKGHSDWIFDVKWLDDQFVVTASRDNRMCLWCIKDDENQDPAPSSLHVPNYHRTTPVAVRVCKRAQKVRAMAYNDRTLEVGALSLNAFLHLWDAATYTQKCSKRLVHTKENVCMSIWKERGIYAVGSQSHVTLVDPNSPKQCMSHIMSKQRGCGIRSVNFNEQMLSIGTGAGAIYFFDLRANKYLELECGHPCSLVMGKGWLQHDETYHDFFNDQEYPNAVYTHCFDESGTKLFAAGGPLPAGLWGNYAGLWQ